MNNISSKIFYFIFCVLLSISFVFLICFLQGKIFDTDYLLNYTLGISIFVAIVALGVWRIKYKDGFENFIVFLCLLFFNMLIIYIGPLTVNRSLSTFVYFLAVENGVVDKNLYDESYYKDFVYRRYTDGEKFGFLSCKENLCKPNIRTKIFYYTLHSIGKITASDKHYNEFKEFANGK